MESNTSRKQLKKAEKLCKSKNYNGECYAYLKENKLLYSTNAEILYKLGLALESKDASKSKECFTIAATKNHSAAKDKLK